MIAVNGTPNAMVRPGATVQELIDLLGLDPEGRGIAVAVDAEVVPRPEWPTHALSDGAHVEVLSAVQGG